MRRRQGIFCHSKGGYGDKTPAKSGSFDDGIVIALRDVSVWM
jgi:hypothetical protein